MKTIIFCIVFFLIHGLIYSQNESNLDVFKNVEIGTKKFYTLQMKDGSKLHARIISVDKNIALVMNSDGNSLTVPTVNIVGVESKEFRSKGSLGAGFGIPYGVFGLNLDVPINDKIYLTGGFGTAIFITPVYNVGCKFFLRSGEYKWRPRLSTYYGSNGILYVENGDISERFHGLTVGIGQQWMLGITKSFGFDFDILYIVDDSKIEQRIATLKNSGYIFDWQATGNIKVSIGVRYCF